MSVTANPTESDRTIVSTKSVKDRKYCRSHSMRSAAPAVKRNDAPTGFTPPAKPTATPANAECESASPVIDVRRRTRKIPIKGQSTAMQTVANKARRMKSNSRSSVTARLLPAKR